jgi:hypothetical protein
MKQLALTSSFCKNLVEPFRYRSISLSDANPEYLLRTEGIVGRLLDEEDGIARHVRDLIVAGFSGENEGFDANVLERVVGKIERLVSFRFVYYVSHVIAITSLYLSTSLNQPFLLEPFSITPPLSSSI